MGFKTTWIARHGATTAELLVATRLSPTGARSAMVETGIYLTQLPQGVRGPWALVEASGSAHMTEIDEEMARRASIGGHDTLFYSCSDTVMCCMLSCFYAGTCAWRIVYDCGDNDTRPALYGPVPAVAYDALSHRWRQQEIEERTCVPGEMGTDYLYEIPADVAEALVGYRHDTDYGFDVPEPYLLLKR